MCFDLRGTAWQHDMLSSVVQQDKRLNNYLDECYILHSNFGGSAASVNQQARFLAFIRVKPDVTSPAGAVVAGKRRMIGSRAFHYNLKASWNGIYIYSLAITQINVINWITTKFCTCHYSTAVGACAKFSLWPRILSMNTDNRIDHNNNLGETPPRWTLCTLCTGSSDWLYRAWVKAGARRRLNWIVFLEKLTAHWHGGGVLI